MVKEDVFFALMIGAFGIISAFFIRDLGSDEFRFMGRMMPLILIPITFATNKNNLTVEEITLILSISSIIACIIGIVTAMEFYSRPDQHFTFIHLPHTLKGKYHSVYFSLQLGINVILLFIDYHKSKKIYKSIFMVLFFAFMIILGKRMALISLFLVLLGFILTAFNKKRLITFLCTSAICLVFYFLSPYNQWRFTKFEKMGEGLERIIMTKASLSIIKEQPIFGVGTANINKSLKNEYAKRGLENNFFANNPHNQYLYITIGLGLIGLIIYALTQGILLKKSYAIKNRVFLVIYLYFFLISQTESILIRQQGIVLYALIISSVFYGHKSKQQRNIHKC